MSIINWLCAVLLVALGIFTAIVIDPLVGVLVAATAGLKP